MGVKRGAIDGGTLGNILNADALHAFFPEQFQKSVLE
jgi:hypothetical protein